MENKGEWMDCLGRLYHLAEKAEAMSEELSAGYFRRPVPCEREVVYDYGRYRLRTAILEDYMEELIEGLGKAVKTLDEEENGGKSVDSMGNLC